MKWQEWFYFTRGQRHASLVLIIVICVICGIRFFGHQSEEKAVVLPHSKSMAEVELFLSSLQKDSIKKKTTQTERAKKTTSDNSAKTKKKTTAKPEKKK